MALGEGVLSGARFAGSNGSVTACGHVYLDGGEDLSIGGALDNYLSLTAEVSKVRSAWTYPASHQSATLTAAAKRFCGSWHHYQICTIIIRPITALHCTAA